MVGGIWKGYLLSLLEKVYTMYRFIKECLYAALGLSVKFRDSNIMGCFADNGGARDGSVQMHIK